MREFKMTNEDYFFTCKDCGSHDLVVVNEYEITENITKTLDCVCGNSNGIAALRSYCITTEYKSWGVFDDTHRWGNDGTEELNSNTQEDDAEVLCSKCLDDANEKDWKTTDETEQDSDYYVKCNGCDREIEFGWSHADGGRIWPAEYADFNPWKCFPDEKYKESWAKKNWLRTKQPKA